MTIKLVLFLAKEKIINFYVSKILRNAMRFDRVQKILYIHRP